MYEVEVYGMVWVYTTKVKSRTLVAGTGFNAEIN